MDPQLRAHYNKYGKDKDLAPEGGFADPREHFQQMFGGDAFRSKCECVKKGGGIGFMSVRNMTTYHAYSKVSLEI